jgi:hypothetical protein
MIVCDTGPLVAAALSDDDDHRACVELLTGLHLANRAVLVPAPVVPQVIPEPFHEIQRARITRPAPLRRQCGRALAQPPNLSAATDQQVQFPLPYGRARR